MDMWFTERLSLEPNNPHLWYDMSGLRQEKRKRSKMIYSVYPMVV